MMTPHRPTDGVGDDSREDGRCLRSICLDTYGI